MTRNIFQTLVIVSLPLFVFSCACLVSDEPLYKEGATPGDLGTFPGGCEEVSAVGANHFDDAAFRRIYANLRARKVRALNLTGTLVTDDTLGVLRELETLTWLDASDTRITPDGILRLKGMPRLAEVIVSGPAFDIAAVERLSREMSPIKIHR
jgi:hypothetical protein